MTDANKRRRLRASENFRNARAAAGEKQVQIWMKAHIRERLDREVKAGRFRNRSEAIAAALNSMLEGQKV